MVYFEEMYEHFKKRTQMHINLVQKYCAKLDLYVNLDGELIARAEKHDVSKFGGFELIPYVHLTWRYKCKDAGVDFEVSDHMENMIAVATEHHVLNNPHHPEYYGNRRDSIINIEDRDAPPDEAVKIEGMPLIDLAEMLADWCSVSKERGNTPMEWADKNIGARWDFPDDQVDFIYNCLNVVWSL